MSPVIEVVGWALIHFVWQASGLGLVTAIAMKTCRRPTTRYLVACLGLAAMLVAPIVTIAAATMAPSRALTVSGSSTSDAGVVIIDGNPGTSASGANVTPPETRTASRGLTMAVVGGLVDASRVMTIIVIGWMAGVALLVGRLAAGWRRVRRLHSQALPQPVSQWLSAGERLARVMGLTRVPHIVDCALVDVPTVVGWLRPLILLPVAALANLTPAQVDSILAHELAHVRRRDYVVNLLQTLTETLLFYHPAVWWVSARVRVEREHCCDEVAVETCGDAADYARALVELESWRVSSTTMVLAATGGSLFDRVRRIMRAPANEVPPPAGWVLTIALIVLFTAGAGTIGWLHASSRTTTAAWVEQDGPHSTAALVGRVHLWLVRTTRAHLRLLRWHLVGPVREMRGAARRVDTGSLQVERGDRLSVRVGEPPEPPEPPQPPAAQTPPQPPTPPESVSRGIRSLSRYEHVRLTQSGTHDISVDSSFLCFAIPCLHGTEVRARGIFDLKDDLSDVESMSDDGYFFVRVWSLFVPYSIEIRPEGGRLVHRYFVGGLSRRYDDEARRMLARELASLSRHSAFGAESRVRRILAARGANGVLDELRTIDNDFVRGVYFRALFDAANLDRPTMIKALALAGQLMSSDFERSRTLRAAASAAAADLEVAKAYVETTDRISSDFEHRRALLALMGGGRPVEPVRDLIARSAARLHSDFEKSLVLRSLLAEGPFEPGDSLFSAVRRMSSDFEKSRVLRQLLAGPTLGLASKKGLLDTVPSIASDFERSRVLRAMLDAQPLEPTLRPAFVEAANHIGSSFEQNRVLAALVKGEQR